mmetsp:Transcript_63130/g.184609  ORF Transcript_63130/g.184609 Transcript_63130/m.184609 type:complete len:202 (+) Transcript_63130:355-960(+)
MCLWPSGQSASRRKRPVSSARYSDAWRSMSWNPRGTCSPPMTGRPGRARWARHPSWRLPRPEPIEIHPLAASGKAIATFSLWACPSRSTSPTAPTSTSWSGACGRSRSSNLLFRPTWFAQPWTMTGCHIPCSSTRSWLRCRPCTRCACPDRVLRACKYSLPEAARSSSEECGCPARSTSTGPSSPGPSTHFPAAWMECSRC